MFRILISLIIFILPSSLFAAAVSDNHFLIGLSAGPTWISGNQTQTINLEPDVAKTYTGENGNSAFASVELLAGVQRSFVIKQQPVLGQFGIAIVGAGNAELNGNIWEDADPMFDNFTYTYKVNHVHVAVKGRLVGNNSRFLEPYISASLGVGFNHAYHFTMTPKISEEVVPPAFQSNTTTTFSYTLGIGLQKSFTSHIQAAIGYEFADWGKIQLARAPGQTVNQGPSLNHLYAQQLQFSLFYIA